MRADSAPPRPNRVKLKADFGYLQNKKSAIKGGGMGQQKVSQICTFLVSKIAPTQGGRVNEFFFVLQNMT